jgi:transposase-like protein
MNELKTRGVQDILIAAVDGITGFPDAINTVFPKTEVQLCMRTLVRVHMVRNSVKYVPFKGRKAVTGALKKICLAPSAELAEAALDEFASAWDAQASHDCKTLAGPLERGYSLHEVLPGNSQSHLRRQCVGNGVSPEPVNYSVQKIIKKRQSFPTGEAAMKLIFMGLQHISQKWTMPIRDWGAALNQFAIIYGDRLPL